MNIIKTICAFTIVFLYQFAYAAEVLDSANVSFTDLHGQTLGQFQTKLPYLIGSNETHAETKKKNLIYKFDIQFESNSNQNNQFILIKYYGSSIEVKLNGGVIFKLGKLHDTTDNYGNIPILIPVYDKLVKGQNHLTIETLYPYSNVSEGIFPEILLGSEVELSSIFNKLNITQSILPNILSTISTALGIFCFILWYKTRDNGILWYGLAETTWGIHVFMWLIPELPISSVFAQTVVLCFGVLPYLFLAKFVCQFTSIRNRLNDIITNYFILICPFAIYVMEKSDVSFYFIDSTIMYLIIYAYCISLNVYTIYKNITKKTLDYYVLNIFCLILSLFMALKLLLIYDFFGSLDYSDPIYTVSRYGWAIISLFFSFAIAEKIRRLKYEFQYSHLFISNVIEKKEIELNEIYQSRENSIRSQAVSSERERLARDLHDGVSNQLTSTTLLAQSGAITIDEAAIKMNQSLLELKLLVDSLHEVDGDINSVLGELRYRLAGNFQTNNIEVVWQTNPLPTLTTWAVEEFRNFQMLVYEAFMNILKYAKATTIRLSTHYEAGQIVVRIEDDGQGFDVAQPRAGNGLRNMRSRAQTLGAQLHIESSSAGTKITLTIPASEHDIEFEW